MLQSHPRSRQALASVATAVAPLLAAVVLACLGVAAVAAAPEWFRDAEELINATVARELLVGNGRRYLLEFQYAPFCGGCTAVALLGWLAFAIGGVHFLAWKAVPAFFTCAILLLGHRLLARGVGRPAAWCFMVLWLGIPTAFVHASMMVWGNHFEVTALILLQAWIVLVLVTPNDPIRGPHALLWVAWGGAAGLGFWFCFGSAFVFPALFAVVALSSRRRELPIRSPLVLLGLVCGLAPLLLYAWKTGNSPFIHRYLEPGYGGRRWLDLAKLADVSLLRYANALFYVPGRKLAPWPGWLALASWWTAVGVGAALGVKRPASHRIPLLLPALLLAAAVGTYVAAPFSAYELLPDGLPRAYQLRYLVPALILLLLAAAAGIGQLWQLGGRSRVAAIVLAAAAVAPGGLARVKWLATDVEGPDAAHVPAYDYPTFIHEVGASRITSEQWLAIEPRTRLSLVNHRRAYGAAYLGEFLSSEPDPEEVLAFLRDIPGMTTEDAPLLLHGLGRELVLLQQESDLAMQELLPRLVALLDVATPRERQALASALWANNASLLEELDRPLPHRSEELPTALGWPLSGADCALCPALGEAIGRTPPPTELDSPDDLVPDGLIPDDPGWRAAILTGAGARYGRAYGYAPTEVSGRLTAFSEADRAAFMEGFMVGTAQAWDVQVGDETAVQHVP